MSGHHYDSLGVEFYVCDKCTSFDVYNAMERNYNPPKCNTCGSWEVSPNEIFNSYKFKSEERLIKHIIGPDGRLQLLGMTVSFDRETNLKIIRKKKKFLMKKFGRSRIEFERDITINNILNG